MKMFVKMKTTLKFCKISRLKNWYPTRSKKSQTNWIQVCVTTSKVALNHSNDQHHLDTTVFFHLSRNPWVTLFLLLLEFKLKINFLFHSVALLSCYEKDGKVTSGDAKMLFFPHHCNFSHCELWIRHGQIKISENVQLGEEGEPNSSLITHFFFLFSFSFFRQIEKFFLPAWICLEWKRKCVIKIKNLEGEFINWFLFLSQIGGSKVGRGRDGKHFRLTGVQPCVLLNVRQLLEAAIAVRAFVGLLASVYANVLNELMIAAEALQALLALVRLDFTAHSAAGRWRSISLYVAGMLHLHCALMHENLRKEVLSCRKSVFMTRR